MHTNILNKNIYQFMQFNIDTSYRSRYQLNKSKLKIRGSCIYATTENNKIIKIFKRIKI